MVLGFRAAPLSWSYWNFENVFLFLEGGRKKKKPNPHMTPGLNRTRDTLVGGERSHYCAFPAPLKRREREDKLLNINKTLRWNLNE